LKLQDYDFTLRHIPGKTNTKANILSRKDQINTKEDNKDIQMLKKELWMRKTIAEVMMLKRMTTMNKQEILEEIRGNGTKEREVIKALEKNNGLSWEEEKIVYMEGRIYVPNNKKLKEKILQENHSLETTWDTKENSQRLRATVCIKIYGRIYESTRNNKTAINNISSSNR